MKKAVALVLVFAGLTGRSALAREEEDAERVFARVSPSVVTIKTFDEQGRAAAQGSGVVVGAGLVATNCHVIEEASAIRVLSGPRELAGRWLRRNAPADLCLLAVGGLTATPVPLRQVDGKAVGEAVFAVGNPLGFGLAVSSGLLASARLELPQPFLVATAPQSPGSSGGGLFDREGRLLGITRAVLGTGQNFNMILPAEQVARILVGGDEPPPAPQLPAAERAWATEAEALAGARKWTELEPHARAWMAARPRSAHAAFIHGSSLVELQRYAEAESSLRRTLELDRDHAQAWELLASVQYRRGARDEAEKSMQEAASRQPFSAWAPLLRSSWLFDEGRLAEAEASAQEAIRRNPGSAFNWRQLGLIEDRLGKRDDAVKAFATALRLGDPDSTARRRLAELYAETGKPDEARRVARDAAINHNGAEKTQLALGFAELNRGRLGPAEEAMRKAVELAPESADAWTGLGAVLMKLTRLAEAEKAFDQAVRLAPGQAIHLANRSMIRLELKRVQPALDDAQKAIEVDPKSVGGWRQAALAYLAAGKPREAGMAFQKLDALSSLTPDERVSWAESLLGTGNPDQALAMVRQVEAVDPKLLRMCLTTAKILGTKGDIEGALRYELRAIDIDPVNVLAWSGKGFALMKLGRLPEAVEALETAVRLDPEQVNAWVNLGEAQLRSRNLGRAIQALEKAVSLKPSAVDARIHLAQAYLSARLFQKARAQAESVLETQPNLAPALGLLTMSYLAEGNGAAAAEAFQRFRLSAPEAAKVLRAQALGSGLPAARSLPE
jgi:tetratricopeptide (TPR) repeat protein